MSFIKQINLKRLSKHIVLALILFFVLVFLGLFILSGYTRHGDYIEVPNLINKTESELKDLVKESELRYEIIDSGAFNPNIQAMGVIEQNPLAGTEVKENRKIYLTVNPSSPGFVNIPSFKDKHIRRLVSFARATNLVIERIEYKADIANCVVIQISKNGEIVQPDQKIGKGSKLTVLLGKANGRHSSIPNLIGNSVNTAKDKILSNGLNIGVIRIDEDAENIPYSELVVYKQEPKKTKAELYSLGKGVSIWLKEREKIEE